MKSAGRACARKTCRVICRINRINSRPPIRNRSQETKEKEKQIPSSGPTGDDSIDNDAQLKAGFGLAEKLGCL